MTASAGNAGLGVAWAASVLGVHATVVVAETASPAKVAALQALPVELVQHGADYDEAEAHALSLEGATYVSSYNDTGVIAGQSTIGRELDAQIPGPLTVVAPLGGGSLASGLGLWAAAARGRARGRRGGGALARDRAPRWRRGGSRRSRWGTRSPTGSPATSSPARSRSPLVRDHVAAVVQASEAEIEEAIRFLARAHGIVAEGAGATAVAGVLAGRVPQPATSRSSSS